MGDVHTQLLVLWYLINSRDLQVFLVHFIEVHIYVKKNIRRPRYWLTIIIEFWFFTTLKTHFEDTLYFHVVFCTFPFVCLTTITLSRVVPIWQSVLSWTSLGSWYCIRSKGHNAHQQHYYGNHGATFSIWYNHSNHAWCHIQHMVQP